MNKKTFFSILAVLVLFGGGLFLYFSKESPDEPSRFSSFFGFGGRSETQGNTTGFGNPEAPQGGDQGAEEIAPAGIRKIHDGPVAGFSVVSQGGAVLVRYQERTQGYIHELTLLNGAATRISSTTFPAVYESFFGKSGQAAYVRTLNDQDTIKTTLFTVARDVSYTLANSIESLVVSPDTQKAFYLVRTTDGVAGYTTAFDTATPKKVFTSTTMDWLASWTNPTSILLGTKPSAGVPGSLSLLNTKTLSVSRALSGIPGVTGILSPTGKTILYTKSTDSGMETSYYAVASGVSQKAPFTTLPEKCVWSTKEADVVFCAIPRSVPRGEYPDQWYQGVVSFSDEIWKFDAASASPYGQVVVSNNIRESVDAVSLTLSPDESYLVFLDRHDGALWGVNLLQETPDIE